MWKRNTAFNDREARKIMVGVENKGRVISRIVTGHCDLSLVVSKLSWSLAIDHVIVLITVGL